MLRLVADRFLAYDPEHGWDLATGAAVRLIDATRGDGAGGPALPAFVEVLDHGREGEPRWIEIGVGGRPGAAVQRLAADARARGYVPIAADMYVKLGSLLNDVLQERTLLVLAGPHVPHAIARRALVGAATRSPRPHVLLSFGSRKTGLARAHWNGAIPPAGRAGPAYPRADGAIHGDRAAARLSVVREARAAYAATPLVRGRQTAALPEDVARHLARGARADDFVRAGRHAAAERLLRDVAAALVRRRSFAAAAQATASLGRLLIERGRPIDADAVFAHAASQAETAGEEGLACGVRIWQANARADAGRLTAAEALVRAVLLCDVMTADQQAHARATLVRILLWQRRTEDASRVDLILPGGDAESHAYAASTLVRRSIESGQLFEAGQAARALLTASANDNGVRQVIARAAHFRVLLASGDLGLARDGLTALRAAVRTARTPLRLVRARLLWFDALVRAGRDRDAAAERAYLDRVRTAVPPLLRSAIEQVGRVSSDRARPAQCGAPVAAAALVSLAQSEEEDQTAVRRVLEVTSQTLQASRIELCSADAGPCTPVVATGGGPSTRLGPRVLEAGIALGPEPGDPAHESGVPVRLGPRLLAALVARWPADRQPPPQSSELLKVAAAVCAPRVDAMLKRAREEARASTAVPELVGVSAAIADLRKAIARAAQAPFAVLIEGESGVGKELVARALHQLSPRRERRFCDVNCAALPDELLESELFGHARGSFTGAVADRAGLVEEADGGTLFLDEVADLSPRAQAKLLRVIQQQEVRRVGESFTRPVDVRTVCAANRDMRTEAAERRFRQDLLYRLDVIRLRIPPLRERPGDVALLAEHFWRTAAARVGTTATLTHGVLAALTRYHWPGNARELQNVMAALAVAAPARGPVRPGLLPAAVTAAPVPSARLAEARAQFERRFVEVALARAGGRRSQAARELGLSRQGLLKLLARHGLT